MLPGCVRGCVSVTFGSEIKSKHPLDHFSKLQWSEIRSIKGVQAHAPGRSLVVLGAGLDELVDGRLTISLREKIVHVQHEFLVGQTLLPRLLALGVLSSDALLVQEGEASLFTSLGAWLVNGRIGVGLE